MQGRLRLRARRGNVDQRTRQDAEYGPDGKFDGRILDRYSSGTTGHFLYERGNVKLDA